MYYYIDEAHDLYDFLQDSKDCALMDYLTPREKNDAHGILGIEKITVVVYKSVQYIIVLSTVPGTVLCTVHIIVHFIHDNSRF